MPLQTSYSEYFHVISVFSDYIQRKFLFPFRYYSRRNIFPFGSWWEYVVQAHGSGIFEGFLVLNYSPFESSKTLYSYCLVSIKDLLLSKHPTIVFEHVIVADRVLHPIT